MKNIKIGMKLMLSFGIVLALSLLISIAGIFGLISMDSASDEMYSVASPLYELAVAIDSFERLRMSMSEIIFNAGHADALSASARESNEAGSKFERSMGEFNKSIRTENAQNLWTEIMDDYYNVIQPVVQEILDGAKAGTEPLVLYENMKASDAVSDIIVSYLIELIEVQDQYMESTNQGNSLLKSRLLTIIISVSAAGVIITITLAVYISGIISAPLQSLTAFMKKAGKTGDISLRAEDIEVIGKFSQNRDEIGQCIGATASFVEHVSNIAATLNTIAKGDISTAFKTLSEEDVMGLALNQMLENLNRMFVDITLSSEQVRTGAKQVAGGAQSLAQGCTEQAASVEEFASSIADISSKTKSNAEMARKTAVLAHTIKTNAEQSSLHMDEMITAVSEINEASSSIGKVIKVIDDIAFQTNILALNAAVEAARAGQHGKGFAVVAEEVRNLAAKSAEAAKDTSGLIENSIEKANLGVHIASDAADSLAEIVGGIVESNQHIDEIAGASEEQSVALEQINIGIDQIAQVVTQNSATAEESAAASEEMSSQSTVLQELISQFKLKDKKERRVFSADSESTIRVLNTYADIPKTLGNGNDFGKY